MKVSTIREKSYNIYTNKMSFYGLSLVTLLLRLEECAGCAETGGCLHGQQAEVR